MLHQITLKCPILLLSRGHFRETATFRGGLAVYFQEAFILGFLWLSLCELEYSVALFYG